MQVLLGDGLADAATLSCSCMCPAGQQLVTCAAFELL